MTQVLRVRYLFCLLIVLTASVALSQQKLVPYKKGNKWGFANTNAKIVIKPKFAAIKLFRNNLVAVKDTNKHWGLIDRRGNYVVAPRYDSLWYASDGVYRVRNLIYSWIDTNGVASDQWFADIGPFSHGNAIVMSKDLYGVINMNGRWVLEPKYVYLADAGDGVYTVRAENANAYYDSEGKHLFDSPAGCTFTAGYGTAHYNTGEIKLIDRSGKNFLPEGYELKEIRRDGGGFIVKNVKTNLEGAMDTKKNWILEPRYQRLGYCSSLLLAFTNDSLQGAYLPRTGRWLKPKAYSIYCNPLDSAYYLFRYGSSGPGGMKGAWQRSNCIDSTGKELYAEDYNWIERSNGFTWARRDSVMDWFDRQNKRILRFERSPYTHATVFDDQGYAIVDTTDQEKAQYYGLINTSGQEVLPCRFDYISYSKPLERYLARRFDYSTVIFDPRTASTLTVDNIPTVFSNGYFLYAKKLPDSLRTKDKKYSVALLNKKGETVIASVDGFIEELGEQFFLLGRKENWESYTKRRTINITAIFDHRVMDLKGNVLFTLPDEPVRMREGFFYFPRSGRYMRTDGKKFYED